MVRNEIVNHIESIEPYNDRIMSMKIGGKLSINIISTYAHPADKHSDLKTEYYKQLKQRTEAQTKNSVKTNE